ncbi:Crp/Fnr family transcriptional regulator [Zhouia spongiae]|uniref:Crp/Fnr family transcriptional regulator n=1 Tax=Zhouia spongiae TaxID=2202721 RepID=A0ABY3YSZ0_9FLAO|nr:Crp/Fnr family transcriptional regulator [Zhouia spongiae]UNZ00510.1 Crp/Fnr family transcriptional regulator [Zhouia spongiae]
MFENFKNYLVDKSGIEDQQCEKLADTVRALEFKKGTYLLQPGEVCYDTFFVEQGLLRAFTVDEDGKEHIIQFAPESWLISDRSSAYFNEPADYFIEAIEDTVVILVNKEFINKLSEESESFRKYNNRLLHNHIRHLQKRINLLLGASAEKRYLDFIKLHYDLTLRVPQWMIASYLGITPESLSRVRKELAKKNFKL